MVKIQWQQELCAWPGVWHIEVEGANIDCLLQTYLTCHTLNYVLLFSSTTTLEGKVCLYDRSTILLTLFSYEKYFHVSGYSCLQFPLEKLLQDGYFLRGSFLH